MGTPETRATATAVAWAHAEAALNGVDPACGICASFTLARANKRLAFWERTDAGKAAPAPSGRIPPESLLDFSDEHASGEEEMQLSLDVKPRATSPPATSRTRGGTESSELPRSPSPSLIPGPSTP